MRSQTMLRSRPTEGPVLVRIDARDATWVSGLPTVIDGRRLGMTVGDTALSSSGTELAARGYDLIDVVPGRRPGRHADVLVPADLRTMHPRWFAGLLLVAERVFDLRFGPVHVALHDELVAHLPDHDDGA
jgi:hypothetical protein